MEYGYSGFDEKSKVHMLVCGINTILLDACKAAILVRPEMQGDSDISARHFIDFIAMTPSLQKKFTAKVSSVNRSGGGRGGGRISDHGYSMPAESDVQATMGAIKKKYFRVSEQGYVTTAEYKKIYKDQKKAV